jgi:hypothetical protein
MSGVGEIKEVGVFMAISCANWRQTGLESLLAPDPTVEKLIFFFENILWRSTGWTAKETKNKKRVKIGIFGVR